jgi:tRNA1Val (adenine37-N6)-methyltransferase
MELTHGHLLGGRVRYAQPKDGFRSGIEPVLLAAAVPARTGERVLEAGTGAGAALLCLRARVNGIMGVGVERDAELARVAADNAVANNAASLEFIAGEIETVELSGRFDHACANPPYHRPSGTRSPVPQRDRAKRGSAELLGAWCVALGRRLHPGGTLTLILPAAMLEPCLAALSVADCKAHAILPLWPGLGRAAKLVLVQGLKGGRSPLRMLPGLVLHAQAGGFTEAAEAILRDGAAVTLG